MKYTIAFLSILLTLFTYGQTKDYTGRVIYLFSHQRDTLQTAMYTEEMMLDFNSTASVYKSYKLYYDDSVLLARAMQGIAPPNQIKIPKATFEQQFYLFDKNEHFLLRPWVGGDTLVINDPQPPIAWNITGETRWINGLNCILATGAFRGRVYHAWFCPDIPVKAGPWKLNGLPGLIIEAADTKGQVKFELQRLHNIAAMIQLPQRKRLLSKAEWEQMMEGIKQNPTAFIHAAINGQSSGNASVNINRTNNAGSKPKNSINNPLELTN